MMDGMLYEMVSMNFYTFFGRDLSADSFSAGLLLLGDLTQSSTELQKLVAFENTFDRLFNLLQLEGGLSDGGIIVQDCLDLLANLIRQNSSNQSLFRESGCIPKLSELLKSAYAGPSGEEEENGSEFPNPQRDKNLWGLLAVIRLFLVSGSAGTQLNQRIFHRHGVLQQILDLPFRDVTEVPIRAEVSIVSFKLLAILGSSHLQGVSLRGCGPGV
jgi:intracellular protein transport protein USO1